MLQDILTYYNNLLYQTGFFEANFDLAERVCDGDKEWYAVYHSDSQYAFSNQDFSNYRGISYWFLNNNVQNRPQPHPQQAGKWLNNLTIPIGLVCVIPRDLIENDCSTTTFGVMQTITKAIITSNKALKSSIGAISVEYGNQNWITDRKKILDKQYKNTGPVDVDYKYHYFQLNLDINVVIPTECIEDVCA